MSWWDVDWQTIYSIILLYWVGNYRTLIINTIEILAEIMENWNSVNQSLITSDQFSCSLVLVCKQQGSSFLKCQTRLGSSLCAGHHYEVFTPRSHQDPGIMSSSWSSHQVRTVNARIIRSGLCGSLNCICLKDLSGPCTSCAKEMCAWDYVP